MGIVLKSGHCVQLGQAASKLDAPPKVEADDLLASVSDLDSTGLAEVASITRKRWPVDELLQSQGGLGTTGWDGTASMSQVEDIVRQEPSAERSLMHRFNVAQVLHL
jgi:hypothetical protein